MPVDAGAARRYFGGVRAIVRYLPPSGVPVGLPGPPPKTTFGGARSREGRRIADYMQRISPDLAPFAEEPLESLGMKLEVGLSSTVDLLTWNDLDNYLEPLVVHLRDLIRGPLVTAWASKRYAGESTLVLGEVQPDPAAPEDWMHVTASARGLSVNGLPASSKRDIGIQIAAQAQPMPWAPVDMELALRVGRAELWIESWKSAIDSLVAILGRLPGKSEFDIKDGRIVNLGLHREVDDALRSRVELEVWWRQTPGYEATEHPQGPLSYQVGPLDPALMPRRAYRSPRSKRRPRADRTQWPALGIAVLTDLEEFRQTRASGRGYVVITDDSNPIRIHRADCPSLKDEYFEHKVVHNAMRTGEYFRVADPDVARNLWPGLSQHDCTRCGEV